MARSSGGAHANIECGRGGGGAGSGARGRRTLAREALEAWHGGYRRGRRGNDVKRAYAGVDGGMGAQARGAGRDAVADNMHL